MDAILIISIFLLAAASFALIRSKRPRTTEQVDDLLPPPRRGGLFGDGGDCLTGRLRAEYEIAQEETKSGLRARAAEGDAEALRGAHATGDAGFYQEILDTLVRRSADDPEALRALHSFIVAGAELRSSPELAARVLKLWEQNPTRASAAELLRVAALSDDAATFERAAETVHRFWREGRLGGLRAEDLRDLCEGEYWLLSSEAKRSGAGFLLKQRLADMRRRLTEDARREPAPPAEAGEGRASS